MFNKECLDLCGLAFLNKNSDAPQEQWRWRKKHAENLFKNVPIVL